ncbi:MAG: amino acid ABC transporter permease [Alphaproteobacteria bacterium]
MTIEAATSYAPGEAPRGIAAALAWVRRGFFSGPVSTAITIVLALGAAWIVPRLVDWALIDAVWRPTSPDVCREAVGACWAVVVEKHRLILFGTYPFDQQWRGWLVTAILFALVIASVMPRFWSPGLMAAWAVGLGAALALQFGGVLGLPYVPTEQWGGLPMTMLLFVGTVVGGLPLAILLALGRRSALPAVRTISIGYIEVVRGIPLVNILFVAALLFPLFMPEGVNFDKLLRAQIGMIAFFAAYAAEVVRGGLQAVAKGQYEAADSLGLGYWTRTRLIVLPQALRIVIPPLLNDVIRAFKNTSLLLIIGLFDILGATRAALEDPNWARHYFEAYLFVAALYFLFCFSMSRYSERMERTLARGRSY